MGIRRLTAEAALFGALVGAVLAVVAQAEDQSWRATGLSALAGAAIGGLIGRWLR